MLPSLPVPCPVIIASSMPCHRQVHGPVPHRQGGAQPGRGFRRRAPRDSLCRALLSLACLSHLSIDMSSMAAASIPILPLPLPASLWPLFEGNDTFMSNTPCCQRTSGNPYCHAPFVPHPTCGVGKLTQLPLGVQGSFVGADGQLHGLTVNAKAIHCACISPAS